MSGYHARMVAKWKADRDREIREEAFRREKKRELNLAHEMLIYAAKKLKESDDLAEDQLATVQLVLEIFDK